MTLLPLPPPAAPRSEKFGWDPRKVDEALLPVLKVFDTKQKQLNIDSFLSFNYRFAKIGSKRLQAGGGVWVCVCVRLSVHVRGG